MERRVAMFLNKYQAIESIEALLEECDLTLLEAIYNAIRNMHERSFQNELQRRNKKANRSHR